MLRVLRRKQPKQEVSKLMLTQIRNGMTLCENSLVKGMACKSRGRRRNAGDLARDAGLPAEEQAMRVKESVVD